MSEPINYTAVEIDALLAYHAEPFEPCDAADDTEARLQINSYHAGYIAGVLAVQLLTERWRTNDKDQEIDRLNQEVQETARYRQAAEHYRQQAMMDHKVGLFTHAAFKDKVRGHIENSQRETDQGITNYLMIIDIDHFKININDAFGHVFGDEVLVQVANTLRQSVREEDEVGRYGGEEFIGFFRDVSVEEALDIAKRFQDSLKQISLRGIAGRRDTIYEDDEALGRSITVSIGMAPLPQGGDLEASTELADTALYYVKRNGRDNIATNLDEEIRIVDFP